MTEVNQHQMPNRHVIDNVEKAIQVAKDAEMAVRHAQLESNPQKLRTALAQLETAQHALGNAQAQLKLNSRDREHHGQEFVQVQNELTQSEQSLDITSQNTELPKQVR
ncbi:hypothetical protein PM3016_850 [Paenibacillus mucilaginosus 3016]|uniref:Uncharacterized protein n=1 Tax=Paenibacillus mucilaginosus 3016 TaxID=1116391 RepID=H6N952_9BACL|nr:hypothetical protein [Paenibacillus mucilaginosus]AFC27798.1 hypothetical protein PM3016_850 [Paenibacillus mucilaginosus 3016]WFA22460.1 hypothetical protein ERY13_04490 [Paenibacillus mucilaginosus]